jgi:hypothetical protein
MNQKLTKVLYATLDQKLVEFKENSNRREYGGAHWNSWRHPHAYHLLFELTLCYEEAGDSWHSSKIIRADEKTQESSK